MIDTHVHTEYSCDSKAKMKDMCKKAVELEIKYICFTDHVDYNPMDEGFGYYNREAYLQDIYACRREFGSSLNILSGIEFSEPHEHDTELRSFNNGDYDMIIGSIHMLNEGFVGCSNVQEQYSHEELEEAYFDKIEQTVKNGGFDTLGHLDLFKRYTKTEIKLTTQVKRIIKLLVDLDVCMEINTSSIRKGCNHPMPSEKIIDYYIKAGGNKLTIGSDAHISDDLGKDIVPFIKKYRKYLGIFVQHEFILLESL